MRIMSLAMVPDLGWDWSPRHPRAAIRHILSSATPRLLKSAQFLPAVAALISDIGRRLSGQHASNHAKIPVRYPELSHVKF